MQENTPKIGAHIECAYRTKMGRNRAGKRVNVALLSDHGRSTLG